MKGKKKESQNPLQLYDRLALIYRKFPKLPFLDRSTSSMLILAILLYLLFTAYVFLTMPRLELSAQVEEKPLTKNVPLQLAAGEAYSYEILQGGAGQGAAGAASGIGAQQMASTVSYAVLASPSCKGLEVVQQAQQQSQSVCILKTGNLAEEGYSQINSGFGNRSILLFAPWMLAVSDDFRWEVSTSLSAGSSSISTTTLYRANGRKQMAGRQSFLVEALSETGEKAEFYVDAEKRVLLYAAAGGFSAKLVSAPFYLNWANSTL